MMSAVQDVGYLMDPGLFSHDQKGKGKNTGQGPMMFVDSMILCLGSVLLVCSE